MNLSVDQSNMHLDNCQHGPHLRVRDIHHDFVLTNKLATQSSLLQQQHTQSCTTSKPYESHVAKGLSSTPEGDADESKLSQYQEIPINSLINTLMQQYHPSFLVENGKTTRYPCLQEVMADVRNGGISIDSTKPKFITSKWDEDEKWTQTKLSSTHSTYNALTHNAPLFKLSHNEHTSPVVSVEQERFSLQPSYDKAHLSSFEFQPCHFQTDAHKWDKYISKNEVEKLTDAVSCTQSCLERIQPIPPPRNMTNNPFLAQGVFRNRADPTMTHSTFKHSAQVDPVMTKSVLSSPHVPITGTSNIDLFWSSPIKADKHHLLSNTNHLTAIQASQKEMFRPSGPHSGSMKPPLKDTESRGDFSKIGEHFHMQKLEKSGQARTPVTSYMKDACTEITPTSSHRDMGTQMTPVGSSRHSSRPQSPQRGTALSPARHNTPARISAPIAKGVINMSRMNPLEVERCHRAKLELQGLSVQDPVQQSLGKSFDSNWSSREEEEEDIGKGLRHLDLEDLKQDVMEARASAWKEATRQKLLAKYEREETKIQAWEELQAAKAEADLKKLEMKLEKKRIRTTAKIASKLGAAHKRADEWRAAAKTYRVEALEKTNGRAEEMCNEAEMFQASYPWCACFSHSFGG